MKGFISNNEFMEGIAYKTKNVIIQKIQQGKKRKRTYIIGTGYSLSVDDNDIIIKHDPFMSKFTAEIEKDDTVYAFYFTFECSGLEASSREIADFVNHIQEEYEQIVLVGHSKCGICLTNASCYCEKAVILVTISTPYWGTVVADKKKTQEILQNSLLIKIYNMIFSDHNVDKDIAPDSICIKNIRQPICKEHINIVSWLRGLQDCQTLVDIFLLFWGKIMKIDGDGIVSIGSQCAIGVDRTRTIFCSHASSLKKGIEIMKTML